MGKIATYAAVAISIAAAIPTGGTSLLGSAALSAGLTASAATASLIASGVALAANIGAGLLAKKPSVASSGTQTDWSADPNAPVPIIFGRTGTGGNIVYRKGSGDGDKNKYQTLTTILSLGPIADVGPLYCDRKIVPFSGTGVASGIYFERLWRDTQAGVCPEAAALNTGVGNKPGWTGSHKLSGLAADQITMLYDAKGKNTFTTEPQMLRVPRGVLCYDPREDSTFPGGSGSQRAGDPTTWAISYNGFIQGLTFALGWYQNGKRRGGAGQPIETIDVASFVECANIADLNGWKSGGEASTGDDKWQVMKALLQACGGEPIRDGDTLSCIIQAPRVSIATIGAGDLIGKASRPRMRPRKERLNGIVPKYRSEAHFWEQVSGTVARIGVHLAEDGEPRTREIEYPMVQVESGDGTSQPTQIAGYDVEMSRECMPITLPLKLRWIGYRVGDCISCAIDELGLADRQLVIVKRALDPATCTVTLTVRTEDPDKHARVFALTGDLPPVTEFERPDTPSDYVSEPDARGIVQIITQTVAYPVTSDETSITIAAFTGTLTDGRTNVAFPAGSITGLDGATDFAVTFDGTDYAAVPMPALDALGDSGLILVGVISTLDETGTAPPTETPPPGTGGSCPQEAMPVLLATPAGDGPGAEITAGEAYRRFVAGERVRFWTAHEHSGAWGAYPVKSARRVWAPLVRAGAEQMPQALPEVPVRPMHATADHPIGGAPWTELGDIGAPEGMGWVIAFEVEDAHTFVCCGVLSHNKLGTGA